MGWAGSVSPFHFLTPASLPHVDGVATCASVCVCGERPCYPGVWAESLEDVPPPLFAAGAETPGRVAFPSPRGANKSLGLRGEDRDAALCAR